MLIERLIENKQGERFVHNIFKKIKLTNKINVVHECTNLDIRIQNENYKYSPAYEYTHPLTLQKNKKTKQKTQPKI